MRLEKNAKLVDLGYSFFPVIAKEKARMQKVLILTPHLSY